MAFALATAGCSDAGAKPEGEATFKVLSQPKTASSGHGGSPPLPAPSVWTTPLEDPDLEAGRVVWTGTCIQCHSIGLGGAPLIGNAELWGPRIAQGLDVLYEHALDGFYGDVGEMPARGGNAALSDDEVRAAVRFMTSRVPAS
ncbi:MAG: c-type cytochrome [Myxococcota bacterium]